MVMHAFGERMGKGTYGDMNGRMSEGSSERGWFDGLCGGRVVAYRLCNGRELHAGCGMVVSCMGSCVVAVRGVRSAWVAVWWQ